MSTYATLIIEAVDNIIEQPKRVICAVNKQTEHLQMTQIDPNMTTESIEHVLWNDQGATDHTILTHIEPDITTIAPVDPNCRTNHANSSSLRPTETNNAIENNGESRRATTTPIDLDVGINQVTCLGMGATPNRRATRTPTIDSIQGINSNEISESRGSYPSNNVISKSQNDYNTDDQGIKNN